MPHVPEILTRMYSNVNYELTPALCSALFVCGCIVVGGLVGGQFGLLIGGCFGGGLSLYFERRVVSFKRMIKHLSTTQRQTWFTLLSAAIISIVVTVLNRSVDNN